MAADDDEIIEVEQTQTGVMPMQDPISQLIMLPFQPFLFLMQLNMQLMKQNQLPNTVKVTTINKNNDSLKITECQR